MWIDRGLQNALPIAHTAVQQVGKGDCDKNEDCEGSLVCGTDNCRKYNPSAMATADCCATGKQTLNDPAAPIATLNFQLSFYP